MCTLQAVGLLLSAVGGAPWVLIAGSAVFGLPMMAIVALQPVMTAVCFGRHAFGRIYGPLYLSGRLGSAAGPLLIGIIATAAGSYRPAWLALAAGPVLAAILVPWAVAPVPGRTIEQASQEQ